MNKLLLIIAAILYAGNVSAQCQNNYPEASKDGKIIVFYSDRTGKYEIFSSDEHGGNVVQLTNTGVDSYYPAISTDSKSLAWQEGAYGASAEIWTMNIDGTNQTRLTNNISHDGHPNFSPDGTKLVFEAWDSSNYPEIFTMDINGSNRKQLTTQTGAYWNSGPIYNPSGTKIYFQKGLNADSYYVSFNSDGSGTEAVITNPNSFGYADFALHFRPQGAKIVLVHLSGVDITTERI